MVVDRQTLHVEDLAAAPETRITRNRDRCISERLGIGLYLATPLLREGNTDWRILAFAARRSGRSGKNRSAARIFADQAVIAIENVRLFQEFSERNAELREHWSIRRRRARFWASSAGRRRIAAGLDAIVESAARVCAIDDVVLRLKDGAAYDFTGSFWSYTH